MEKKPAVVVRTSAPLAASGAYDASPASHALDPATQGVTLYVTFARGSSTSAFAVVVEESPDGTTWYTQTVADGGSAAAVAPSLNVPIHLLRYRSPVPASNDAVRCALAFDVRGARYVRFSFAEYGDTANPGTLAASLVEGAS